MITVDDPPDKFLINPVTALNKVTYQINRASLDGPNATAGAFETPGVIKSTGEMINLPQLHQLQSLYLDDQQRLYMGGSGAYDIGKTARQEMGCVPQRRN